MRSLVFRTRIKHRTTAIWFNPVTKELVRQIEHRVRLSLWSSATQFHGGSIEKTDFERGWRDKE